MSDVTVRRFEELDRHTVDSQGAELLDAGRSLGVSAWEMNLERLPPHWDGFPDHDHAADGKEEVYVMLEGSAVLHTGDRSWTLEPGTMARVGPAQKRKLVPGGDGATVLVLGGIPGKPYSASSA